MEERDEAFEHAGYPIQVGASSSRAGYSWSYQIHGIFKESGDRALPTHRIAILEGIDEAKRHAERLREIGGPGD